jgi:hypothetical protein
MVLHRRGFEDLQISDNYAFGDTKDRAITNYEAIMLQRDDIYGDKRTIDETS